MDNWDQVLHVANSLSVIAVLVVVLYGGLKQWWVYGYQYRELKNDRDEWKELALSGTQIAQHAVGALHKRRKSDAS